MFPPKGKKPDDKVKVIHTGAETRPLKRKNHDNKAIAGERNFAIAKNIKKYAVSLQNGFIAGRNFLCNVVGIDAFARFASYPCNFALLPLIVLFDLKAAFPSVAHQWLFKSLAAAGASVELMNFVKALYISVRVFVSVKSQLKHAFFARSGVLTGCPLSATLFVIAMDPFLKKFNRVLVEKSYGVLYACADDLGGSLLRMTSLLVLHTIFDTMATVAGLILNTSKCVIIPLVPSSSPLFCSYRVWLEKHIPDWASFKIATHAEYLGFEVGPEAGSYQWVKVLEAFNANLTATSNSGAPPSISVFIYNAKLVPKFSYKAQLVPPVADIAELEKKWSCNILKAPFKSFPPALLYCGKSVGFYQLSSVKVQSSAAAIRAAWSTVNNWKYWFDFLNYRSLTYPCLTLGALGNEFLSPPHWDSPPFAVNLAHANAGIVLGGTRDFSSAILPVKRGFYDPEVASTYKKTIQKHLAAVIKSIIYPNNIFYVLHLKAHKQTNIFCKRYRIYY